MKTLSRIGALALCLTLSLTLIACTGKTTKVEAHHVDVHVYADGTRSAKLTNTGENRVNYVDGVLRVDVANDVTEVEFEVSRFFTANEKFKGKNFHFTRDDVKKGDGTMIRGSAWVEVGGECGTSRTFKKLGYENDTDVKAKTKHEIANMESREGETRMYIMTKGDNAGKHLIYLDATTSSTIKEGETRVTFRFHGHHGKTAELRVLVNKAAKAE